MAGSEKDPGMGVLPAPPPANSVALEPIGDGTTIDPALTPRVESPARDYVIAAMVAVAAILIRALLERWLSGHYVFVLSLLAVMFVAWNCGRKPALLAL